jgi:hypothetical protein
MSWIHTYDPYKRTEWWHDSEDGAVNVLARKLDEIAGQRLEALCKANAEARRAETLEAKAEELVRALDKLRTA